MGTVWGINRLFVADFEGTAHESVNIPKPLINRTVLFRSAASCNYNGKTDIPLYHSDSGGTCVRDLGWGERGEGGGVLVVVVEGGGVGWEVGAG